MHRFNIGDKECRGTDRNYKLYKPLIELIDSLQDLKLSETVVEDVRIGRLEGKEQIRIEYAAWPEMPTITKGDKVFSLRVTHINTED